MDIKSILKKENISIIDKNISWEEAIRIAAKPLVEQGFVEERYPDEIIKNTLEFGPYYILAEDVAFLHVRPEQGVIKDQISIMVDKKSVSFSEVDKTKNARLFITFAAQGSENHVAIMQIVAELLSDEDKILSIINSNTSEEIYNLIK